MMYCCSSAECIDANVAPYVLAQVLLATAHVAANGTNVYAYWLKRVLLTARPEKEGSGYAGATGEECMGALPWPLTAHTKHAATIIRMRTVWFRIGVNR